MPWHRPGASIFYTMRVLGLDIGERRIGVAISDELGLTAQPLEVIERDPRRSPYERLSALVQEHGVKLIVAGLPRLMNDSEGAQAAAVRAYARGLRRRLKGVEIVFQDERLTTAASERLLLEADVSRAGRRRARDKVAAALILQMWLDANASRTDAEARPFHE
ncbi:MAG: Holliday junction resolvase RuvX [Candidatus Sumerlaeia bacterium]